VSTTPIADYALLSDRHSAALVSKAGSIDWLCLPRFDRPSVFGRLLDDDAGHWSIQATGATEVPLDADPGARGRSPFQHTTGPRCAPDERGIG